MNLKQQVKAALKKSQTARDDDVELQIDIAKDEFGIDASFLRKIPSGEAIARCRRAFQQKGKYPASENARVRRAKKEEEYYSEYHPTHKVPITERQLSDSLPKPGPQNSLF